MKKIVTIIVAASIILSIASCGDPTIINVNAPNQEELTGTIFGKSALVEIGDGLYYDSTTRIVYWWNGNISPSAYAATVPTPYYAPNGIPYKYNPETNTFEEIERGE